MSLEGCVCGGKFNIGATMGTPNCVQTLKAVRRVILQFRTDNSNVANTVDLTATNWIEELKDKITDGAEADKRFYPTPQVRNLTVERTDDVFEEAPDGQKYRIEGVGGVYMFNYMLWGKDAAPAILKEANRLGCTEMNIYLLDAAVGFWGIKEGVTNTVMRGIRMTVESFVKFMQFATDTSVTKIESRFDLMQDEDLGNLAVIPQSVHGLGFDDFAPAISGTTVAVDMPSASTIQVSVRDNFGSAISANSITGLDQNTFFEVYNISTGATTPLSGVTAPVESPAESGDYTLTLDAAAGTGEKFIVRAKGVDGYVFAWSDEVESP